MFATNILPVWRFQGKLNPSYIHRGKPIKFQLILANLMIMYIFDIIYLTHRENHHGYYQTYCSTLRRYAIAYRFILEKQKFLHLQDIWPLFLLVCPFCFYILKRRYFLSIRIYTHCILSKSQNIYVSSHHLYFLFS